MIIGITSIHEAAIISSVEEPASVWKRTSPLERTLISCEFVTSKGQRNAFHELIILRIAIEKIACLFIGTIILTIYLKSEHLSTFAARYKDCKFVTIKGDTHCYDNHLDEVTAAVKEFMLERI